MEIGLGWFIFLPVNNAVEKMNPHWSASWPNKDVKLDSFSNMWNFFHIATFPPYYQIRKHEF